MPDQATDAEYARATINAVMGAVRGDTPYTFNWTVRCAILRAGEEASLEEGVAQWEEVAERESPDRIRIEVKAHAGPEENRVTESFFVTAYDGRAYYSFDGRSHGRLSPSQARYACDLVRVMTEMGDVGDAAVERDAEGRVIVRGTLGRSFEDLMGQIVQLDGPAIRGSRLVESGFVLAVSDDDPQTARQTLHMSIDLGTLPHEYDAPAYVRPGMGQGGEDEVVFIEDIEEWDDEAEEYVAPPAPEGAVERVVHRVREAVPTRMRYTVGFAPENFGADIRIEDPEQSLDPALPDRGEVVSLYRDAVARARGVADAMAAHLAPQLQPGPGEIGLN